MPGWKFANPRSLSPRKRGERAAGREGKETQCREDAVTRRCGAAKGSTPRSNRRGRQATHSHVRRPSGQLFGWIRLGDGDEAPNKSHEIQILDVGCSAGLRLVG